MSNYCTFSVTAFAWFISAAAIILQHCQQNVLSAKAGCHFSVKCFVSVKSGYWRTSSKFDVSDQGTRWSVAPRNT